MPPVVDTYKIKIEAVFEYLKQFEDGQKVQVEDGCQTALECLADFYLENYPEDSSERYQAKLIADATREHGNYEALQASSQYEMGFRTSRHPHIQFAYDVLAEAGRLLTVPTDQVKSPAKRDDKPISW